MLRANNKDGFIHERKILFQYEMGMQQIFCYLYF